MSITQERELSVEGGDGYTNPYLGGNFAPVPVETTVFDLPVRGRIPDELDGRLMRIGPNPTGQIDPQSHHWFMGSGMVHGVRMKAGQAEWYRSRFVLNDTTADALKRPRIGGPDNGPGSVNTNLALIGGRLYALVEAGSLPIEIDDELGSVQRSDFGGTLEGGFAAHPKRDPATGELIALAYQPGRQTLRYVVIDSSGRARTMADIAVPHGPMVHDVGFTDRFIVVLDLPVVFKPEAAMRRQFPYQWSPGQAPRLGLLPRSGEFAGLKWFDAPQCAAFHIMNAFDRPDGSVVVDICRHPRIFDVDWNGPGEAAATLARWTIDLESGRLSEAVIEDRGPEFPRLNSRFEGREYRYGYTSQWQANLSFGPVMKHDMARGGTQIHDFGRGRIAMEPVFVPRQGATDEDDGYVMTYVFDTDRNATDVVILSAQDFSGPPVAEVRLPIRVPFGFHGGWAPERHR